VDSFLTTEDAEPEILQWTEDHQQRYNELVHGPAQMVMTIDCESIYLFFSTTTISPSLSNCCLGTCFEIQSEHNTQ